MRTWTFKTSALQILFYIEFVIRQFKLSVAVRHVCLQVTNILRRCDLLEHNTDNETKKLTAYCTMNFILALPLAPLSHAPNADQIFLQHRTACLRREGRVAYAEHVSYQIAVGQPRNANFIFELNIRNIRVQKIRTVRP
ncbi:hypothetical protein PaecuDRAFT_4634 [Paenibacillus curdlanolyticus YK9]|uniref:Uncharacterized protein n=1 Tax=Paenibacillus curdlanolyticus YK9 TaxID=717606 RepID=E0IG43_9BACL|nr:hypothetical protein PaecuDRAFT_4634 [Paenibacillus curdlanolyticus YK9]